jgi:hypothetical protein
LVINPAVTKVVAAAGVLCSFMGIPRRVNMSCSRVYYVHGIWIWLSGLAKKCSLALWSHCGHAYRAPSLISAATATAALLLDDPAQEFFVRSMCCTDLELDGATGGTLVIGVASSCPITAKNGDGPDLTVVVIEHAPAGAAAPTLGAAAPLNASQHDLSGKPIDLARNVMVTKRLYRTSVNTSSFFLTQTSSSTQIPSRSSLSQTCRSSPQSTIPEHPV